MSEYLTPRRYLASSQGYRVPQSARAAGASISITLYAFGGGEESLVTAIAQPGCWAQNNNLQAALVSDAACEISRNVRR